MMPRAKLLFRAWTISRAPGKHRATFRELSVPALSSRMISRGVTVWAYQPTKASLKVSLTVPIDDDDEDLMVTTGKFFILLFSSNQCFIK